MKRLVVRFPDAPLCQSILVALPDTLDLSKETLVIRSTDTVPAHLHTDTKTFALHEVLTSDTLLVVDGAGLVKAQLHSLVEVRDGVGQTDGIYEWLGPAWEEAGSDDAASTLKTARELLDTFVLSEAEMYDLLARYYTVILPDGRLKRLSLHYVERMLRLMVTTAIADDLALDALTLDALWSGLSDAGIPRTDLLYVLKWFSDCQETTVFALSESRVCRFMGQMILLEHKTGVLPLNEFMAQWQARVFDFCKPNLEHIKDMYTLRDPDTLLFINERKMTRRSFQDRLKQLFNIKPQWTLDELKPCFQGIVKEADVERQLLKWTQVTRVAADQPAFYAAKPGL